MNAKLEERLQNYYRQFDASQQRLHDRLAAHFAEDQGSLVGSPTEPSRPSRRRTRQVWRYSAIATTTLIAVGLWFAVASGPGSLYAQAVRAIQRARTVHAVAYRFEGAERRKRAEVWYDKDRGVREIQGSQVGSEFVERRVRLDDGSHQWVLDSKAKTVRKTASVDPTGVVLEMLCPEKVLKKCVRRPALDCVIGGENCLAYVRMAKPAAGRTPQWRASAWLDPRGCVRRFEEEVYRDGRWEKDELVEAEFDVAIEPGRFKPDFSAGFHVIDNTPQKRPDLARLHTPEKSLFVHEEMGLILAVHEVTRVEEDMVLVVYSVQPSPETLQTLGEVPTNCLGDSQLDSSFERTKHSERSYQPLGLGNASYHGINVQWWLLIEQGEWPEPREHCDLGVYLYARNELQESLRRSGQPWYTQVKHLAQLPFQNKLSIEQALAHVHAEALAMESVGPASLSLDSQPLTKQEVKKSAALRRKELEAQGIKPGDDAELVKGMSTTPWVQPSTVSPDRFAKEIRSRIGKLRRQP